MMRIFIATLILVISTMSFADCCFSSEPTYEERVLEINELSPSFTVNNLDLCHCQIYCIERSVLQKTITEHLLITSYKQKVTFDYHLTSEMVIPFLIIRPPIMKS